MVVGPHRERELVAFQTTVEMEDKSSVRFDVALDHSEYQGSLNFGAFRANVTQLISSLGEALQKGEPVPVFTAQDDTAAVIFGVTALSQEADKTNVMVLSANMAADQPSVLLKLMYLDHEQFIAKEGAGHPGAGPAESPS